MRNRWTHRLAGPAGLVLTLAMLSAPAVPANAAVTYCMGQVVTILGTPANESILGTAGVDVIDGGPGHDDIVGLDGNDYICGGDGNDYLIGGQGDDRMSGGNGTDRCDGGPHIRGDSADGTCESVVNVP
ncbi:hypothetical protein J5X84_38780 [Streptosporangiaceae bacterium NEAU-GS5]|nr:hypothetical protein [Streptosporangiaceae bacterium NEAU-GS5]